jgi:hypothetical protein
MLRSSSRQSIGIFREVTREESCYESQYARIIIWGRRILLRSEKRLWYGGTALRDARMLRTDESFFHCPCKRFASVGCWSRDYCQYSWNYTEENHHRISRARTSHFLNHTRRRGHDTILHYCSSQEKNAAVNTNSLSSYSRFISSCILLEDAPAQHVREAVLTGGRSRMWSECSMMLCVLPGAVYDHIQVGMVS